jgi:hypothetical protein
MDFEEVRRETERAHEEAEIENPDLSYLTPEGLEEALRDARELSDVPPEDREGGPEATNLLWNVWFTGGPGSAVYGYLTSSTRVCGTGWYIKTTWTSRSVYGQCSNRGSYIWRVA